VIISVTTTFDANSGADDAFPGDGQCETAVGNGVCTLRAAIEEANAHAGPDGIFFDIPTSDPGYSNGTWTIKLSKALPNITDSVNINGPGSAALTVSGNKQWRVFTVTTGGMVNFSGLTIAEALAPPNEDGGGIQNVNSANVNVTNCILRDNVSGNANVLGNGGSAISNSSGTVNVTASTLEFNRAAYGAVGGGIVNRNGTLSVTNSTFDHNSSAGQSGGAIFNNGSANITGCTFHDNSAFFDGGAIVNFGGTLTVTNSTFYANIAFAPLPDGIQGQGGAIFSGQAITPATLYLSNCTITANFSGAGGSGVAVENSANVKSNIIASNYGGVTESKAAPDVSGAFSSKGFNLIGKKDGSTGFTLATDKKGTIASPLNPGLDPKGLRSNGGPTQTIALMSGSPAVDKGTSAGLTGTLTTDQRGFARTVDKSGIANATGGDGTDIGAYELGAQ
jgi:CSLREA domain-containing protein